MRCEDVLDQLNARADGELPANEAAALDAHLAECSQCRAAAESLQAIDAELRTAFASRRAAAARLAERAAAAVRASAGAPASIAPPAAESRWAWGQAIVGLAAGFLLAVALFRPWQPKSVVTPTLPQREPIARLAVASGWVEVQAAGDIPAFMCPPSAPIGRDSMVRTGPTERCEISLEDGNALRLDCNTEVTLRESEVVEVNHGRLWLTCEPGRKGIEIQSGGGTIVAKPPAHLAVDCQPQAARLMVVDGAANVQAGQESIEVGPGKQVRIVQGKVEEAPVSFDPVLETAWVNSVLALRGSEHPELVERVDRLLANVGAAKLSLLYEDELRRLGDDGVPPLVAYLAATRDTPNVAQRGTAARIVADVAQSRWIADLIALLTDANAEVRFHAARGLERLTGRNQGCDAQKWQSESWASCESAHEKWLNWWAANRDRYPAARRDIPAPTSPPF
ncbi:MAG: zf-HC2 domain-containing protein [Planctomycetia bacterium]|nr:zf-HC2 domain-containing protein [Planctomycetia bacterium]